MAHRLLLITLLSSPVAADGARADIALHPQYLVVDGMVLSGPADIPRVLPSRGADAALLRIHLCASDDSVDEVLDQLRETIPSQRIEVASFGAPGDAVCGSVGGLQMLLNQDRVTRLNQQLAAAPGACDDELALDAARTAIGARTNPAAASLLELTARDAGSQWLVVQMEDGAAPPDAWIVRLDASSCHVISVGRGGG